MTGPTSLLRPSRSTWLQRITAELVRAALRATVMPTFRAGRPIEQQRTRLAAVSRMTFAPRGARYSSDHLGGIPGEWADPGPDRAADRVILYLHGGGYCVGSPRTHRALTGHLARRCAARVFAADYRLAPEHRFPAAVDDAVSAYSGLLSAGWDPQRIVLAGDSAGGGLCVAAALELRELGRPQPRALVLFSPWADLSVEALGDAPPGEPMITKPWVAECARLYLGDGDARDPRASPVFATLTGLPRTLIQAGTDELLLPDSKRLDEALRSAGVDSTLRIYPRCWHVFQVHAGMLRDADRALDEVAEFLAD